MRLHWRYRLANFIQDMYWKWDYHGRAFIAGNVVGALWAGLFFLLTR